MISINFIIELPKSIEFDVVMTMVNLVSKTTYFTVSPHMLCQTTDPNL